VGTVIATALCDVVKPFPVVVTWQTCVASPQVPGATLTVARIVAVAPALVVISPVKAGNRAATMEPVSCPASMLLLMRVCVSVVPRIAPAGNAGSPVISEDAMLLLVSVCASVVPTIAPLGAVRLASQAEPLLTAIPAAG
jgi:hypothetical protein